jgi:LacI family transcriptional regulator
VEEKRRVTRDDVAAFAGVSSATVSYVLNDGPRPVSEKTKAKVLQAIDELGYQPNILARNLRRQRTSTLGLIIPDTLNPYFAEVARGVEAAAFDRGYTVVLCHSRYSVENEQKYVDVLRGERAAGAIWIPATADFRPAAKFVDFGMPLIILDRVIPDRTVYSVTADNFRGGYLATEHLISLGHRRIAFISRSQALTHTTDRMLGYQAALEKHGLPVEDALITPGGYALEDGLGACKKLLQQPEPPTGIFAYNDIMAIGALRAANELGYKIPADLSVVGFDDIPFAAYTTPPLTTIRLPKFEMGRCSAEMLIDLVEDNLHLETERVIMNVDLITRASSAPPPEVSGSD